MPELSAPTIDRLLVEFLADAEQRLAARTFRNYAVVIDLLRDCLNGYGHASLDPEEWARWEDAAAATVDIDCVDGDDFIEDYLTVEKVGAGAVSDR